MPSSSAMIKGFLVPNFLIILSTLLNISKESIKTAPPKERRIFIVYILNEQIII